MDARQFEKEVLQSIRCGFPELYAEHIKGRKRAFVGEHLPLTTLASLAGKVIGKVPPPARMVWAVAELLNKQEDERWNWDLSPKTHSELCWGVNDSSEITILHALVLGFWECCTEALNRPKSGELWTLTSSWDIVVLKYPEEISKDKIHSMLERISSVIVGAALARRYAELLAVT